MDSLSHALCRPLHFNHQPHPHRSFCDRKDLHFVTVHSALPQNASCDTLQRRLVELGSFPLSTNICVPGEPALTAVYSFPARPLRKDSSRASAHIWMTQRLEAGGSRQSWRGLHSMSVLCLNHPYFFCHFLCTRPY